MSRFPLPALSDRDPVVVAWDGVRYGITWSYCLLTRSQSWPFTIAIVGPRSAATAVLLDSGVDIPSWRYLQQQQNFKRQPLGGLHDLEEKDGSIMVAMMLIEEVSTSLLMIKDC